MLLFLVSGVMAASTFVAGVLWARWLRRRAVAPPFAAWTAYALLAFAAFTPVASVGVAVVMIAAVASRAKAGGGGVGTVSVSLFSGPILLAGAAAILLALLVLAGATGRWHWFARSSQPKNEPPYR
jgi:hypothetical protein